jgi:hypothetical protein
MSTVLTSEKNRFKIEKNKYSMLTEIFKSPVPIAPIVIDFTHLNKSSTSLETNRESFTATSQQETNDTINSEIETPICNHGVNETLIRIESGLDTIIDLDFTFMNDTTTSNMQPASFESLFSDNDFISSINFDFETTIDELLSETNANVQPTFDFDDLFPLYAEVPLLEN